MYNQCKRRIKCTCWCRYQKGKFPNITFQKIIFIVSSSFYPLQDEKSVSKRHDHSEVYQSSTQKHQQKSHTYCSSAKMRNIQEVALVDLGNCELKNPTDNTVQLGSPHQWSQHSSKQHLSCFSTQNLMNLIAVI